MSSFNDFVHELQSLGKMLPALSPVEQVQAAEALKVFSSCVSAQYLPADSTEKSSAQVINHSEVHTDEDLHGDALVHPTQLQETSVRNESTNEHLDREDLYERLETGQTDLEIANALTCLEDGDGIFCTEPLQEELVHVESISKSLDESTGWYMGRLASAEKSPDDIEMARGEKCGGDISIEHAGGITQDESFVDILRSEVGAGTCGMSDLYSPGLITVIDEQGTLLKVIQPQNSIPTSVSEIQSPVEGSVCIELPVKTPSVAIANEESKTKPGCLKQNLLKIESDPGKITPKNVTFSCESPQKQFIPKMYSSKLTVLTIPSPESRKITKRRSGRPKKKLNSGSAQSPRQSSQRYIESKILKSFKEQCTCTVCGKILNNPSNVKVHMRTHSGDRPYVCKYCSQGFTTQANLARHIVSHTGMKQYKCGYCAKYFTEKKSMLSHQRVHTGEMPYQCQVCYKMFKHSSSFRAHRLLHFGGKKHVCETCGKQYLTKGSLQSHLKSKHQIESNVGCELCPKELHGGDVEQHCGVHLDKKYACEQCSAQFACSHSYESHMAAHHTNPSCPVMHTESDEQEICPSNHAYETGSNVGSGDDSAEKVKVKTFQNVGKNGDSSSVDYFERKHKRSTTHVVLKEPMPSYCSAEKRKGGTSQSVSTPPKKFCGFNLNILSSKRSKKKTPVVLRSGQFVLIKKGTSPSKLKSAGVLG